MYRFWIIELIVVVGAGMPIVAHVIAPKAVMVVVRKSNTSISKIFIKLIFPIYLRSNPPMNGNNSVRLLANIVSVVCCKCYIGNFDFQ